MDEAIVNDVVAHDSAVARSGTEIWLGCEPTFTHPSSQHPCWFTEATGGEKEAHALAVLLALAPRLGGVPQLLRVPGRHYPGEAAPRWCYGALFERRAPASGLPADTSQLDLGGVAPAPFVSRSQGWLTVTPDPGVVEINMAPAHNLLTFAHWASDVYAAASDAGLSALRLRYNGEVTDSGGGGQLTFGGPSPATSPFFVRPQLLPGLVRYLNRHPALSYLFAPAMCGSASQGPRIDETVRERFDELPVALDYLATRGDAATPPELWEMLAPLLVDASGCSHRAEINIEKLWNPWFGERGQLGLVELRALRMPATPARLTAVAALFRSVVARLAAVPYLEPVVDWGARLHESCSLPWYLERDLESVLVDLEAHGFGLGPALRAELLVRPEPIVTVKLGDATLEVRRALSFWPLLGDVAAQASSGARLVDSSASRIELLLSGPAGSALGALGANGIRVPLQPLQQHGSVDRALGSVVYRSFVPRTGLHPAIGAQDPLVLEWRRLGGGMSVRIHAWQPGGGAYAGLPADEDEARRRREERTVFSSRTSSSLLSRETRGLTLDLRRHG